MYNAKVVNEIMDSITSVARCIELLGLDNADMFLVIFQLHNNSIILIKIKTAAISVVLAFHTSVLVILALYSTGHLILL